MRRGSEELDVELLLETPDMSADGGMRQVQFIPRALGIILSAISWALGIVHVRAHRWSGSPLSLGPWQMALAGVALLILSLAREDIAATNWDATLIHVLAFVGIAATAFAYWGAVTVTRSMPAMVVSLGFLGVPIVGIGSSAVILMEPLTLTLKLGAGLILFGLLIMTVFGHAADA